MGEGERGGRMGCWACKRRAVCFIYMSGSIGSPIQRSSSPSAVAMQVMFMMFFVMQWPLFEILYVAMSGQTVEPARGQAA